MKKSLSIFLSMLLLVSSLLVCLIFTGSAEAKTVVIADFDGEELGAKVNYPTDGSVTVESAATPSLEGKSLKMTLRYTREDGQITYEIGKTVTFPADMKKKYVSFWMKSDVDCKIKVQIADSGWSGDKFYDVEIQSGTHMYNVDISDCKYLGTRGIFIRNWGEYYETAPTPFSGTAYLDSVVITDTPRTYTDPDASDSSVAPEPKTADIADFDGEELGAKVNYPTDGSVTVESAATPSLEGKSLKMTLRYTREDGQITYEIGKTVTFPADMKKKYVSFWMKSDVDCKIKVQIADSGWSGDKFYDVEIQSGTHMYNVDISDCKYLGTRGIFIRNWGEYYETAPTPFSGTAYLDSVIVTDTPRTYTDPDASDTSDTSDTSDVSDTSTPEVNTDVLITDFEEGQLSIKEGPYMHKGKEYDIATSPVYSGSQSLKMILKYDGDWTRIEWVMEPASYQEWPHLNSDSKYLSFWMNSDVDCVLQAVLLDKEYAKDESSLINVKKGTHFYNVDISGYKKDAIRGVMFRLDAEDYEEDGPVWKGTIYLDSVILTATPRTLPGGDTSNGGDTSSKPNSTVSNPNSTSPSTGVGIRLLPLALIGFAGAAVVMLKKKK